MILGQSFPTLLDPPPHPLGSPGAHETNDMELFWKPKSRAERIPVLIVKPGYVEVKAVISGFLLQVTPSISSFPIALYLPIPRLAVLVLRV